jgi:hypothetical protein
MKDSVTKISVRYGRKLINLCIFVISGDINQWRTEYKARLHMLSINGRSEAVNQNLTNNEKRLLELTVMKLVRKTIR